MLQLILYTGTLFVLLFKSRIKLKVNPDQCFSKKQTDQLKGICALLVIVHHISTEATASEGPFHQLGYFAILSGYLLVGYFFLVSGYGIAFSAFRDKREKAGKKLYKRYMSVLIPYVVITVTYLLYYKLVGQNVGLKEMWLGITSGEPVVRYSWYAIAIIILYTLFEISLILKEKWQSVICFFFMLLGYVAFGIINGTSEHWYNAIIAMFLGVVLGAYKNTIYAWLQRKCILKSIVFLIVFLTTCLIQIKLGNLLFSMNICYGWIIKEICLLSFLIVLLYVDMYITIGNTFLEKLSVISYEIYLTHGFIMLVVSETLHMNVNGILYSIVVVVGTICLSFIEHLINKRFIILMKGSGVKVG